MAVAGSVYGKISLLILPWASHWVDFLAPG